MSGAGCWRSQLYFQSLVLIVKLNNLYSGKGAKGTNMDGTALYEQCLKERVPFSEWPAYVNGKASPAPASPAPAS